MSEWTSPHVESLQTIEASELEVWYYSLREKLKQTPNFSDRVINEYPDEPTFIMLIWKNTLTMKNNSSLHVFSVFVQYDTKPMNYNFRTLWKSIDMVKISCE